MERKVKEQLKWHVDVAIEDLAVARAKKVPIRKRLVQIGYAEQELYAIRKILEKSAEKESPNDVIGKSA